MNMLQNTKSYQTIQPIQLKYNLSLWLKYHFSNYFFMAISDLRIKDTQINQLFEIFAINCKRSLSPLINNYDFFIMYFSLLTKMFVKSWSLAVNERNLYSLDAVCMTSPRKRCDRVYHIKKRSSFVPVMSIIERSYFELDVHFI